MPKLSILFSSLAHQLLSDLAASNCVAITGLSNSGKSTLMRSLATPEAEKVFWEYGDRHGFLIYVDCNRAVSISAQAFYEVVLRTVLERLADQISPDLVTSLRKYYESVTEAESAFAASLSFNLALSDLCEQLEGNLCLLLDEFDEIYVSLDERALLNLRALRDRFSDRLAYATATLRSLPELRGRPFEGEFAELFSRFTYNMPLLTEGEAGRLLQQLEIDSLKAKRQSLCVQLAGGHPGLLIATAQVVTAVSNESEENTASQVSREPQPRAECLKIWNQLTEDEQANLTALALDPQAGLPAQQIRHLEGLSLVRDNQIFSAIFADFLTRKARGPEIESQGVFLDPDSGDVWVDGIRIPVLTDLEFRLLALLYERRDKLTDKYRIVTAVWGEDYLGEVDDARVEKLVSRLRSKIETDPTEPHYLVTQRGRGYKLLSVPRLH
jgi:DNA-binding winged helix-turn-helix (wHTH) protein